MCVIYNYETQKTFNGRVAIATRIGQRTSLNPILQRKHNLCDSVMAECAILKEPLESVEMFCN